MQVTVGALTVTVRVPEVAVPTPPAPAAREGGRVGGTGTVGRRGGVLEARTRGCTPRWSPEPEVPRVQAVGVVVEVEVGVSMVGLPSAGRVSVAMASELG